MHAMDQEYTARDTLSHTRVALSQLDENTTQTVPTTTNGARLLWESYRSFVRRYRIFLDLSDHGIERLLFWTPHSVHEDTSSKSIKNQWREVAYGLLSLHRMATDVACQDNIVNSYGASVSVSPTMIPATAIRMTLTVIHALMPAVMEFSDQRHTARLLLERIKYVLRCILFSSYFIQLYTEQNLEYSGLLQDGGMYHPGEVEAPSIEAEERRHIRLDYIGRRTGRRVVLLEYQTPIPRPIISSTFYRYQSILTKIIGELLFIYRPLYWAHAECRGTISAYDWISALGMDLLSLLCVTLSSTDNARTRQEINRRKLKLLLYLLRNPLWDHYTHASVTRIAHGLARIPLLGGLLNQYWMNGIMYWKHPYVSEEG